MCTPLKPPETYNMSTTRLPNLVIAGVVKAGTTSLFKYLSFHPEVCASSVKETCYFMRHRYGQWDPRYQDADDPHQQFQNYFCHCGNQKYIMEATPGYFPGGRKVAVAIKETLGADVKVIVGLRNPVDRLVSVWKSKQRALELPEDLSLADYIQKCKSMPKEEKAKQENGIFASIEDGLYADYLDEWTEVFGDNLKIFFFDDLKEDTRKTLLEIADWLKIDPSHFEGIDLSVENKSVDYKSKFLQKLALVINKKGEPFWRRNQGLKKKLREAYMTINGQPFKVQKDDTIAAEVQPLYHDSNKRLREQLIAQNYTNLPHWLQR